MLGGIESLLAGPRRLADGAALPRIALLKRAPGELVMIAGLLGEALPVAAHLAGASGLLRVGGGLESRSAPRIDDRRTAVHEKADAADAGRRSSSRGDSAPATPRTSRLTSARARSRRIASGSSSTRRGSWRTPAPGSANSRATAASTPTCRSRGRTPRAPARSDSSACRGGNREPWDSLASMLVVTRKKGERVLIGDEIVVTILDVRRDGIRVGVDAPRGIRIQRAEVVEALAEANAEAAGKAIPARARRSPNCSARAPDPNPDQGFLSQPRV